MGDFNNYRDSNSLDSPEFNKLYDQHFFDSQFSQFLYNNSDLTDNNTNDDNGLHGSDGNRHDYSNHYNNPTINKNDARVIGDESLKENHQLQTNGFKQDHENDNENGNHLKEYIDQPLYSDINFENFEYDGSFKRKLSPVDNMNTAKKENIPRPFQPIRQHSNPNVTKRKSSRPTLNKSYSYNITPKSNNYRSLSNKLHSPTYLSFPQNVSDKLDSFQKDNNSHSQLNNQYISGGPPQSQYHQQLQPNLQQHHLQPNQPNQPHQQLQQRQVRAQHPQPPIHPPHSQQQLPVQPAVQQQTPPLPQSLQQQQQHQVHKGYPISQATGFYASQISHSHPVKPALKPAYFDKPSTKTLFEFNKKKPNFHINLDNLSDKPPLNSNSSNLSIIDNDLNLDDKFENVTPNMKPPGTNENDYFEEFIIPSNFDSSNDLSGFSFNLYDDKGNKSDFEFYDNYKDEGEFKNFDLLNKKSDVNNIKSGGNYNENLNDNFNENYNENYNDKYNDNYDENNYNEFNDNDNEKSTGFSELNLEKKSPLTPLSNEYSSTSPAASKISPYSGEKSKDFSSELHRTSSNQSNSSINEKKKKPIPKGVECPICGKYISRDLSRHLRIHDENGRFRCVFPSFCNHKTGKFNRPYDYKKHLLHFHFKFDDAKGKTVTNLTDKLPMMGNCKACNFRADARTWIDDHVLTNNLNAKCKYVEGSPDSTQ